jgi:hypothetical protein
VRDWLRRHGVPVLLRRRALCVASDAGVLLVPGTPVPPELRADDADESLVPSWMDAGKGSW